VSLNSSNVPLLHKVLPFDLGLTLEFAMVGSSLFAAALAICGSYFLNNF
jgi:hypothetical protein